MRSFFLLLLFAASLHAQAWKVVERQVEASTQIGGLIELRVADATHEVRLRLVTFDTRTSTLAVIDNPGGAEPLGVVARRTPGCQAAVNGGYFHPDFTPLGLVISGGATLHGQERAKLLSGIISVRGPAGKITLQRAADFKPGTDVREALQAGPFLLERGQPIAGLEATRTAERTVFFTLPYSRAGLLNCRGATLADLSSILALPDLLSLGPIQQALNLDGGSSSALWVNRPGATPFSVAEWKRVRNFLAVLPRAK